MGPFSPRTVIKLGLRRRENPSGWGGWHAQGAYTFFFYKPAFIRSYPSRFAGKRRGTRNGASRRGPFPAGERLFLAWESPLPRREGRGGEGHLRCQNSEQGEGAFTSMAILLLEMEKGGGSETRIASSYAREEATLRKRGGK